MNTYLCVASVLATGVLPLLCVLRYDASAADNKERRQAEECARIHNHVRGIVGKGGVGQAARLSRA